MVLISLALGVIILVLLSIKWCLPAKPALILIVLGSAIGAAAGWWMSTLETAAPAAPVFALVAQAGGYLAGMAYCFYRDPDRTTPSGADIVAPADGKIVYIRCLPTGALLSCDKQGASLTLEELQSTELARQPLWQIGISMAFTDVHVNRAPIGGNVSLICHRPGRFLSLRIAKAVNVNERQTLLIDNGRCQIAVVQIASRLVRRIESFVQEGQRVELGQRIGIIKFGSQVDVFLPRSAVEALAVAEGDVVRAGTSRLAHGRAGATARDNGTATSAVVTASTISHRPCVG